MPEIENVTKYRSLNGSQFRVLGILRAWHLICLMSMGSFLPCRNMGEGSPGKTEELHWLQVLFFIFYSNQCDPRCLTPMTSHDTNGRPQASPPNTHELGDDGSNTGTLKDAFKPWYSEEKVNRSTNNCDFDIEFVKYSILLFSCVRAVEKDFDSWDYKCFDIFGSNKVEVIIMKRTVKKDRVQIT